MRPIDYNPITQEVLLARFSETRNELLVFAGLSTTTQQSNYP